MDDETMWLRIGSERRSLADLLEPLTDQQWAHPSLCTGWTVRDVASHIAMVPNAPGMVPMIAGAVRARGSFNRLNRELAVRYAGQPETDIVQILRNTADSRRLPAVTSVVNLSFDILVHGQDIAIPLGFDRPMPTDAATAGAERVWTMGWPFWARRRLHGYRLVATDADWIRGAGPEIRAPVGVLLLLMTGRMIVLDRLAGPGSDLLRQQMSLTAKG